MNLEDSTNRVFKELSDSRILSILASTDEIKSECKRLGINPDSSEYLIRENLYIEIARRNLHTYECKVLLLFGLCREELESISFAALIDAIKVVFAPPEAILLPIEDKYFDEVFYSKRFSIDKYLSLYMYCLGQLKL